MLLNFPSEYLIVSIQWSWVVPNTYILRLYPNNEPSPTFWDFVFSSEFLSSPFITLGRERWEPAGAPVFQHSVPIYESKGPMTAASACPPRQGFYYDYFNACGLKQRLNPWSNEPLEHLKIHRRRKEGSLNPRKISDPLRLNSVQFSDAFSTWDTIGNKLRFHLALRVLVSFNSLTDAIKEPTSLFGTYHRTGLLNKTVQWFLRKQLLHFLSFLFACLQD